MRNFALIAYLCFAFFAVDSWAGYDEAMIAYREGKFTKAFEEFKVLAAGGDASAQLSIGVMYDQGEGVQRNLKEAAKWYRRAAKQGNSSAQFNLGAMYAFGYGLQQNDKRAIELFRLSAEGGDVRAQNALGASYSIPRGVNQDFVESRKWYFLAAKQGDADAQSNLGAMCALGLGAPQDFQQAVKWYRLASEKGNSTAQGELGVMYANGSGVSENRIVAYALFNLSLANRSVDTRRIEFNRNNLTEVMTTKEIEEANTLTAQMAIFSNLLKALDSYVNASAE
jgi:TPR repeat protein